MKKVLSVLLSVCMILCLVPAAFAGKTVTAPASAYAEYDRGKISENEADYIASLNYDQLAGILLDWVDKK